MRMLESTAPLDSFAESLVFTESACLAQPATEAFGVDLTSLLAEVDSLSAAKRVNRRGIVRARAQSEVADRNIEEVIRKLQSEALYLAGQRRDVPWFANLFFGNLAQLTKPTLTRQITVAEELMDRLADKDVPATLKTGYEPLFQDVVAKGKDVDVKRKKLRQELRNLRAQEAALKTKVNQTRTAAYGKLLTQSGDKADAERYFQATRRIVEEEEERADEEDASATPAPA
ncbi:MAG: hypothetical protein HYV07_17005 [Deltaproteobacteria bacterium]|nr:hypothetical protein [Deltaproteobacteria bacterium]